MNAREAAARAAEPRVNISREEFNALLEAKDAEIDSWRRDCAAIEEERDRLVVEAAQTSESLVSMIAHATNLQQENAELREWKAAVEEAAVVNWTLNEANANDPRKAVSDLIACIMRESLDPMLSQPAADLHAEIERLNAKRRVVLDAWTEDRSERDRLAAEVAELRRTLELTTHAEVSAAIARVSDGVFSQQPPDIDADAALVEKMRESNLFEDRLRDGGLTDSQIDVVIDVMSRTCHVCWNGDSDCQCWNDD